MQRGIAPEVLLVNGQPSPCECTDKIICAYCVQANLILWEKEEARGPELRPGRLVNTLKRLKQGRVAETLGVSDRMVRKILKTNKIPAKHAQRFYRNFEKGIPG